VTVCGVVRVEIDTGADGVNDRRVGGNYADIKSVHQPLAFAKPIGVRLINRQIGDGRDREFSRRRACNRTGAAMSVPVVLIFLGTAMSAATACPAATSTAYMITDSNNLPTPCR